MTSPPEENWSIGMLHEYIERVLDERDRTYQLRWESDQRDMMTKFEAAREQVAIGLANEQMRSAAAFTAQKESINQTLTAAERAVSKAETAAEKRFDAIMTAHSQLNSQVALFLPRAEFDRTVGAFNDKLDAMQKVTGERIDELRGARDKAAGTGNGLNLGWGYLVAGVTVAVLIVQTLLMYHPAK